MLKKNKIDDYLWFAHCLGRDRVTTFTYMRFFSKKVARLSKHRCTKGLQPLKGCQRLSKGCQILGSVCEHSVILAFFKK